MKSKKSVLTQLVENWVVLVAILEKQSKFIAAITATMPLTAPLAIWIGYSSTKGDQSSLLNSTRDYKLGSFQLSVFGGWNCGFGNDSNQASLPFTTNIS